MIKGGPAGAGDDESRSAMRLMPGIDVVTEIDASQEPISATAATIPDDPGALADV